MAKDSCIWVPYINDKPSKLYKDLEKKIISNRPLVNYIYASYLQSGVDAQMDNMGMRDKDSLGQHRADDVMRFFDVIEMQTQSTDIGISRLSQRIGATDDYGHLIDFDDASVALGIATRTNANNKGVIAYVTQHSDKFNINVIPRDARSQIIAATERAKMDVWDAMKQSFRSIGIDLEHSSIDKEVANANRGTEFASWLNNTRRTGNRLFSIRDIKTLLAISENTQQVDRLKQMFGTLDDVAQKIYEAYRVRGSVTQGQFILINSTLDMCKQYNGLDVDALIQEVDTINNDTQASSESAIQDTLNQLDHDYHINREVHDRLNQKIKTFSDAADEALITLQRQYQQAKAEFGEFDARTKHINRVLHNLAREIQSKRYYSGILGFMTEASTQVQRAVDGIHTSSQATTQWGQFRDTSKAIQEFKGIYSGYHHILSALTNVDSLIVDEIISTQDKQTIATMATQMEDLLEKEYRYVNGTETQSGIADGHMIDLCTAVLGEKLPNGIATANFVVSAQLDSSIGDRFLYSVGRMSNPMIAAMGTIIQDTRHTYDQKVQAYSLRLRRADNRLKKAGFTSDFIYGPDGKIISDIDWDAYNHAYGVAKSTAIRQGLKGIDLDEHMLNWVEQNTMDRVVDYTTGRTERIPNDNYRKAFPQLEQAQLDYYNEMMAIKGELGSLLPSYAQKQYIPPQIRRSFMDAMVDALKGKDGNVFKAMTKAIINKIKNIYTIREDDTDYANNGIIGGEEFGLASGTLANTPFKQIPIFYVNELKDPDELIKDFSGAMQHFMQTALHFEAMNNVRDTLEFMGDFIMNGHAAATKNGNKLAEEASAGAISVFKQLLKFGKNSNTNAIIEGMLDYHLYGVKIKNYNKFTKALKSLLAYNSIRSLTVNFKGMLSNYTVGLLQMIIEAGGNEFYNFGDLGWAFAKVAGDNTLSAPGRFWDFLTNNVNSKSVLLAQRFDPLNEASMEAGHKRYYGPLRTLLSVDLTFMGYGAGEHMIHFMNMYAILHNKKVHLNGKTVSLYDIFSVGNKVDGNSELIIDPNATYTDENGNEVPVDDAYLQKVKDDIKSVNQNTHGSMNDLDKGLIHQYMVGRFIMNLRQWMVEHYSRRYRKAHWDANLKREVEGFWRTYWRHLIGLASGIFHFESELALHREEMTVHQKANVRKARTEMIVLACLYGLQFGLGAPEDHKKEFWYRMWIYQVKRAIVDVQGSTPLGIPTEMNTLINSPIAATNTVNALLYPFVGIWDIGTEIQSGKHKGEDKYLRNLEKYWLPFMKHIEQYLDFSEDEGVFAVFNQNNLQ